MTRTASSRDRRFRRRSPSQRTFWFGVFTPVVLVLAVVAAVVGMRVKDQRPQSPLLAELATLVGDNQLFIRPGLSSDGGPSWSASAYGLPALAAATGRPPKTGDLSALAEDLDRRIDSDPVWARWHAVRVEESTGARVPGSWAEGILEDYTTSDDPAERVALVAATTDVLHAKGLRVPPDALRQLTEDLESAVAAVPSPYSRCRALQAARHLRLDTTTWPVDRLGEATLDRDFSAESVMDVHGALCQAELTGRPHGDDVDGRVLRWLRPHLTMEVAGSEFEAYYLAESWVRAGGERAELAPLAEALRARADAGTGLLKERVIRLGTLQQTYAVAVLAEHVGGFRQIADSRTLAAVREQITEARTEGRADGLLMGAVVLRYAGAADAALEEEAVGLAESRLGGRVDRDNVIVADQIIRQLQALGRDIPALTAEPFPVRTQEDRYLAWTLLGMSEHLRNGPAVRRELADQTAGIEKAFAAPDGLMTKEIAAGLSAAGSPEARDRLLDGLKGWTTSVRGCSGFTELYRPLKAETICTLDATVDLVTVLDAERSR